MTNLIQNSNTQQLVAQKRKGEKIMNNILVTNKEPKERKLQTAHQQNLIELFTLIYFNPNQHTYYTLAHEMSKSERTIQRMIDDINTLYPYISTNINNIDGCAYLKIDGRYSERLLDNAFEKSQYAPLLYVFIKAFLGKKISVNEIMQKLNISKKAAFKMIDKIYDTTAYGDFEGYDFE